MTLALIGIILLAILLAYFKIANKFNIIDKPNERSSHTEITIRGGGIIFLFSVVLWFLFFGFQYPWFALGVLLISIVSFLDDMFTLSTKPRLLIHLLSVLLILYQLDFIELEWYWWMISVVLIIGWINAFNFMDGINGITSFYALITVSTFGYLNEKELFTDQDLIVCLIFGLGVFTFFNARKKAKTFAGDIGSVSLALILSFLMIQLISYTGNWEYILFFAIYGLDAILTIFQRLFNGENIFQAHRSHLYQYLANEMAISHIGVSAIYAGIQFLLNLVIILIFSEFPEYSSSLAIFILCLFLLIYIYVKHRIMKNLKLSKP